MRPRLPVVLAAAGLLIAPCRALHPQEPPAPIGPPDEELEVFPESIEELEAPDSEALYVSPVEVELEPPGIAPPAVPALMKGRYFTLEHLREEYLSGVDYRLLPPRNGQQLLQSRHRQYSAACGLFSVAMITEYLGFAHFRPGGHFDYEFETDYGDFAGKSLDVGYFGSPEHMSADYTAWTARTLSGVRDFPPGIEHPYDQFARCSHYFGDGSSSSSVPVRYRGVDDLPLYGFCRSMSDPVPAWLNRVHMPWARNGGMKRYLSSRPLFGCNDPVGLNARGTSLDDLRRIIKEFVDHEIPLITSSRGGQHWLVIVGYAEVDGWGLPRAIIVSNPHLTRDAGFKMKSGKRLAGPRPKFWVFRNLDRPETWAEPATPAEYFAQVEGLVPWNHHLDGGCEEGGWAKALDERLDQKGLLCGGIAPEDVRCPTRWFGFEVACLDKWNRVKRRYLGHTAAPFLVESENLTCHDVSVSLRDGSPKVTLTAEIVRYGYDPKISSWKRLTAWPADHISSVEHLSGYRSTALWRESWRDGYWWTADGLPGPLTRRRVTVRLGFGHGFFQEIEIAPPGTYGVVARCLSAGEERAELAAEASRAAAAERFALVDAKRPDCDAVELELRLGNGVSVSAARLASFARSAGVWQERDRGAADQLFELPEGLSGGTYRMTWDASWPDRTRWAFSSGPGGTRIRSEFQLTMGDGSRRVVEVQPERID